MTLWDSTSDTPLLSFEVTTTLADQLAFNRYVRTLPAWRQRLAHNVIIALVAAPLLALGVSVTTLWALSGTSCDLDQVSGTSRGVVFGSVLGGILGAAAVGGAILFLFRKLSVESSVRSQLARRPHIDASDPDLRERTSLSMHALGFRSATASAGYAYSWTVTERFDETPDHIFVMVEPAFGFIIPKRDLPPATVLSLREIGRQVCKDERNAST